MNLPRILITGAAGFTGRQACQFFSEEGYDVIPVVRTKTGSEFESKYRVIPCDLTDKNGVMNLISCFRPDYVLHLAGINAVGQSWNAPIMVIEANVMSTLYLLEAIRNSGKPSKVIIVGSALEIDLTKNNFPPHPYSLSKTVQTLLSQSWANLFNMDIMIARPANLIGPGHSNGICSIIARQIAAMINGNREKVIEVNDLSVRRDFLDVRDAVKAYHILCEKGLSGNVYNIATGVTHSLEEMILVFKDIIGFDITLYSKTSIPETTDSKIDTSTMKKLGWSPTIPFQQSIKDVLTFHLEQYKQ